MSRLLFLAAWGVLCYVAGYFTRAAFEHRHVTAREVAMQVRDVKRLLERVNGWVSHWLALIVVAVFVVSGYSVVHGSAQSAADQRALQRQSDCTTSYANQLYESLKPRQSASEALQEADAKFNNALVALLKVALSTTVTDPARHQAAVRLAAAAQQKQEVAEKLSAERESNPYPAPPKEVCPR